MPGRWDKERKGTAAMLAGVHADKVGKRERMMY
jgi:hypothetical protein